ncbi:MAG TPA: hypothetical protein VJQ51_09525 [Burkholderiales bacterium]|nr:hypothetical protein [Burkholderiales bacterium]
METFTRTGFLALVALLVGCSSDAAQRSAYEAVYGAAQKDCRQYPSVECPRKNDYDDYQRQRRERQNN